MLHYDRIEVPERIDFNKTSESKNMSIIVIIGVFRKRMLVSTRCLQWVPWCIDGVYEPFSYNAIIYIDVVDYGSIISGISQSKAYFLRRCGH